MSQIPTVNQASPTEQSPLAEQAPPQVNNLDTILEHLATARRLATTEEQIRVVNTSEMATTRDLHLIEAIDFHDRGLDDTFNSDTFTGWKPRYEPIQPTTIPQHVQDLVAQHDVLVKTEPGVPHSPIPSGKWFRKPAATDGADSNQTTATPARTRTLQQNKTPNPPPPPSKQTTPNSTVSNQIGATSTQTRTPNVQPPPKKKRKIPIIKEFIDLSLSSATDNPDEDDDPEGSNKLFKVFLMSEDRRSAAIRELSHLDPNVGGVIFSEDNESHAKRQRAEFVSKIKQRLESSTLDNSNPSHIATFITTLVNNPESFFHTLQLCYRLKRAGLSEPQEIANRIGYSSDLGKAIIIDDDNSKPLNLSAHDREFIESFDSRTPLAGLTSTLLPDFGEISSLFQTTGTLLQSPNNNSAKKAPMASTPKRGTISNPAHTKSPGNCSFISNTSFSPPASQVTNPPHAAVRSLTHDNGSRPNPKDTEQGGVSSLQFLSQTTGPHSISLPQTSTPHNASQEMSEEEYLAMHREAEAIIPIITGFPVQDRLPIAKWKNLITSGYLQPPLPINCHPRYENNPRFLTGSFCGETFPGVFRPCSSNMNETKATELFNEEMGHPPTTLLDLNEWVRKKFPPIQIPFDASRHCIEIKGYDMNFFREIEPYNLAKIGVSPKSPSEHTPRNDITAAQFINMHHDTLEPLKPYMAFPLLTTLGPSFASRTKYKGYSIPVPRYKGTLVIKDAIFDFNALSFPIINDRTKVAKCAVCQGLLILPDHVCHLAYFWPDDLLPKTVTPAIKAILRQQNINCCYIHALTDGKKVPWRNIL